MLGTELDFDKVADRWFPLIYRGAIEYAIPGRSDVEDLVQEGLKLLFEEITNPKRGVELKWWELDSSDFEKYFKSALFHRFVDCYRSQKSKKRDFTKETHATDDFDPLANIMVATNESAEVGVQGTELYTRLRERLPEDAQQVLDCMCDAPDSLLETLRESRCPECLYQGDPTPDNKCPMPDCTGVMASLKSPSRILQSEIQSHLGMKRVAVSDAIHLIRETLKEIETTPDKICLTSFMELFGYGEVLGEGGTSAFRPWPRVTQMNGSTQTLSYNALLSIFTPLETKLLNFMVSHSTTYYSCIRFTELSRRVDVSVHDLRDAVDSIKVKLELVEAGVELKDVPMVLD